MQEEQVRNDYALVPVNMGDQKKKRNDSLKHKARLMSGNNRNSDS